MWTERDEVERSIRELDLANKLTAVPLDQAQALYDRLEARFAAQPGARWIWQHLRPPTTSLHFTDDRAFERLPLIVPPPADDLLFFPGSDEDRVCAYRGPIDAIVAVL